MTEDTKQGTRPFIDMFRELEHGGLLEHLTDEQVDMLEAIEATGKKGSIQVTFEYIPDGKQVVIRANVVSKAPKFARPQTIFFVGEDKNLQRDDPRQKKLELATPKQENKELREVSDGN